MDKLHIKDVDNKETVRLLDTMIRYLQHSRSDNMSGRSYEYINEKLDTFVKICLAIGLSYEEMVIVLTGFPQVLNVVDSFYEKYLFLGIIENMDNNVRKNKLVTKPKDFAVSLQQIYSRYKLICESGYGKVSWNSLVHATKNEFASIFVANVYYKPYQLFSNKEEVIAWLNNVNIDELDINEYKTLGVNREIVEKYEEREKRFG